MNEFDRWFSDGGDDRYRYDYELNEQSIIFDVGGYEGNFSKKIFEKFGCNIFIFEPIRKYFDKLCIDFKDNPKIRVFNFGLGKCNNRAKIFISDDASSLFLESYSNFEEIEIKDINEFIIQNNFNEIDLLKLNVEGSEFEILENLLEQNLIQKFQNIQVQFHSFIENSKHRRENIRQRLKFSHTETFCYEFVWENWKKNR